MTPKTAMISIAPEDVHSKIYSVRGIQVMLDRDLAELYKVPSGRLNEQVKRNLARFPSEFRFQLTKEEYNNLRSQIATSRDGQIFGASLKDLGKKWFAFSKFDKEALAMVKKLDRR